jgi:hypothetical protein
MLSQNFPLKCWSVGERVNKWYECRGRNLATIKQNGDWRTTLRISPRNRGLNRVKGLVSGILYRKCGTFYQVIWLQFMSHLVSWLIPVSRYQSPYLMSCFSPSVPWLTAPVPTPPVHMYMYHVPVLYSVITASGSNHWAVQNDLFGETSKIPKDTKKWNEIQASIYIE